MSSWKKDALNDCPLKYEKLLQKRVIRLLEQLFYVFFTSSQLLFSEFTV